MFIFLPYCNPKLSSFSYQSENKRTRIQEEVDINIEEHSSHLVILALDKYPTSPSKVIKDDSNIKSEEINIEIKKLISYLFELEYLHLHLIQPLENFIGSYEELECNATNFSSPSWDEYETKDNTLDINTESSLTHIYELKSSCSSPFETIKPLTKSHDSGSWRDRLDISIEYFDIKLFTGSYEFLELDTMNSSSPLWDEYDT